jgi:hypothetical protein
MYSSRPPNIFNKQPSEGFFTTEKYRPYGTNALRGTLFIEFTEPLGHRGEAARKTLVALLMLLLALIPISRRIGLATAHASELVFGRRSQRLPHPVA